MHIDQLRIHLRRHLRHDFSIAVAGRNGQIGSRGTFIHKIAVFRRFLGEDKRQLGPVRRLFSRCRVMHVENDVGPFGNELRGLKQTEVLRA